MGNITQTGLPAILYSYHYRWGKNDEGFAFKSSTEQPVSLSKRIAANYSAIPSANSKIAQTTREYTNSIGDKQYELSNHLGNVLSVITDQKLLNIQRGTPVFEFRFDNDDGEIYPFIPTSQITQAKNIDHALFIENASGIHDQGVTLTFTDLQPGDYVLNFEITENRLNGMFAVNMTNTSIEHRLIEEGTTGHLSYAFTVTSTGNYTLSFLTYENAQGTFILDNIEILDVTGLDVAQVLQNSQEMPIFVPSVLSFSDYYPFGMRVPNRHKSSNNNSYRYGYQGSEKDDEVKGEANSYTTRFRQLDVRLGRWLSIDPKATAFETPYSSMSNNPIIYTDKLGDTISFKGNEADSKKILNSYEKMMGKGNLKYSFSYDDNNNINGITIYSAKEYHDGSVMMYISEMVNSSENVQIVKIPTTPFFHDKGLIESKRGMVFTQNRNSIKELTGSNEYKYIIAIADYWFRDFKQKGDPQPVTMSWWEYKNYGFGSKRGCSRKIPFSEAIAHETIHATRHVVKKLYLNYIGSENLAIATMNIWREENNIHKRAYWEYKTVSWFSKVLFFQIDDWVLHGYIYDDWKDENPRYRGNRRKNDGVLTEH